MNKNNEVRTVADLKPGDMVDMLHLGRSIETVRWVDRAWTDDERVLAEHELGEVVKVVTSYSGKSAVVKFENFGDMHLPTWLRVPIYNG